MFTARTVVLAIALGAGGIAASSASRIDHEFSASAGMAATLAVARPVKANQLAPTNRPAAMVSTPFARRVTAQKVTEDSK
jgi:hypothetical protein